MTPTSIAAYVALFVSVGCVFILVSLLLGWLVRPSAPTPQKLEPYECGEPPVGPAAVQFDLRFYVVALIFIIFEVEVAFFFPPATIYGKATQFMDPNLPAEQAAANWTDMGVPAAAVDATLPAVDMRKLALTAMLDLAAFFAVLLVAFAYLWNRGDLNWVRSTRGWQPEEPAESGPPAAVSRRLLRMAAIEHAGHEVH